MKKLKGLLVTICIVILAAMIGGCMLQDILTPCYLPFDAAELPHPQLLPYDSVFDAKFVLAQLDFQKELLQGSLNASLDFQEKIFSPTGPIGMLLPASMAGILGAMGGGRFLKSPREKELERKVNNSA